MQFSRIKIKASTWSKLELARPKKKKEDEQFHGLATFWFYTLAKLFSIIMSLFGHKKPKYEQ